MYNYNKSQVFLYDPTKLAIHYILRPGDDLISICLHIFEETVSSDDIVHVTDEENIVTYVDFDCGSTFYPETAAKLREINRGRKYFSKSCEKLECNPSNDQQNRSFDEQRTSNIFLNP